MANTAEANQVKIKFEELVKIVRTNPDEIKSRIALASLYIQEARVTGDYMYYDRAAMKYVNEVLEKDPSHFEALTFKSLIFLSQHHFAEGLALAEKARAIHPENAFVHGILIDGQVEMGNYAAAVEEAEKMISIRPDLRSYSRISYLREIHGDYPGAIEAMKMAVDAGFPGDEATEWSRVHLGHLYAITGDMKSAEMHYLIALQRRPGYAYAIAGQARIALAAKDYHKAIAYYLQADSLVIDHSFKEDIAEVYELAGQKNKADSIIESLVNTMSKDAAIGSHDESAGHYADKELAYVYLKSGNYDKALEHALAEYNRRPGNIEVNETVAWVYYNRKEYDRALPYLREALKTKSKNPTLLCRAGLIYAKSGDKEKARQYLDGLVNTNFSIPESLKRQSINELQTL
jgi:tetratricopeptide (TPR) repeat protein